MSHVQHALAEIQSGLDGVGDSATLIAAHDHAVDHDLDLMFAAMVDGRRLLHAVRAPVHAQPHEARAPDLVPQGLIRALPAPLHRRQQVELRPLGQ